jgi:hypothetical protein
VGNLAKRVRDDEVGKVQLLDVPLSSQPVTAVSVTMLQCADAMIHED